MQNKNQEPAPIQRGELAELRRLAEAATPGYWTYWPTTEDRDAEIAAPCGVRVANLLQGDVTKDNSVFIAAANPAVILRLLDALAAPAIPAQEQAQSVPEAWIVKLHDGRRVGTVFSEQAARDTAASYGNASTITPLYAAPPAATPAPMTDAEVWQPIATAPLDGSHVLCFAPELQFVGFYGGRSGWCYVAPGVPVAPTQPTHWQPLPSPPAAHLTRKD